MMPTSKPSKMLEIDNNADVYIAAINDAYIESIDDPYFQAINDA